MKNELEGDESSSYNIFEDNKLESLEVVEQKTYSSLTPPPKAPQKSKRHFKPSKQTILITVVVIFLLGAIGIASFFLPKKKAPKPETNIIINTQSLDNGTLNKLTTTTAGKVSQQLTISPATLFKSSVTVQGNSSVDGNLTVKGITELQGPVIARDTLSIAKTATVGGNLTVSGSISGASLSVGSISITTINVSKDVTFGGHLISTGAAPTAKASVASSGGNVRIDGNDTSGTVIITIGNGAIQDGELAIITFQTPFGLTPHVQITPVGTEASNLKYFVSRSSGFFTINTTNAPSAGTIYNFDYLVTQ